MKEIDEHDCFEHLAINDDSKGSGYDDYLICEICGEVYQNHRYVCWIRPFPHLSDKIIEKLLSYLDFDFWDDKYGEIDIPYFIAKTYPDFYKNETHDIEAKGSYFYEFSDTETWEYLEKKISKVERYCQGWCQGNY